MRSSVVVDASHVVRTVARKTLEELGFAVAEAESGRAALEACRAAPPTLVLCDWELADMPGPRLLKALGEGTGSRPAVVVCARRADAATIAAALGAGAAEYVAKPFDGDVLRARLRIAGIAP